MKAASLRGWDSAGPFGPHVRPGRTIDVDMNQIRGELNRAFRRSVGSDRAAIHLRDEHQRDLRFMKQTCGFEYMRFHGLLNEEMGVVQRDASGKIAYDWTSIDRVYDFLIHELKIRPIVELGFMPEPLASGTQTIFWWRGNVTPPKSYERWGDLVEQLVRHWTERYGRDEVLTWYFEVWNEPNLRDFWPAGREEYFRLYESSARAVKRVDPHYRVGGPATAGYAWIAETLEFCDRHDVPIDFIATHAYGATEGFLDEKGHGKTVLDESPVSVVDGLPGVREAVRNSKWPDLPILVTEWGPSYSARDPVHDSYFCAAWILHRLRRLPRGVEAMSYWAFSDQFEESGIPQKPFHGGFGLLTTQGLPKPAHFAYQFLNQLGSTELHCSDDNAWACCDDRGVQMLLWDYTHPRQDTPNAQFFARDLPAAPASPVNLQIRGLAPGTYRLNITRVGYRHNDVFTSYLELGSPAGQPDRPALLRSGDLAQLRTACSGQPTTLTIKLDDGERLSLELPLNQNDVYLVMIEK